jgi:hypothetical protein
VVNARQAPIESLLIEQRERQNHRKCANHCPPIPNKLPSLAAQPIAEWTRQIPIHGQRQEQLVRIPVVRIGNGRELNR